MNKLKFESFFDLVPKKKYLKFISDSKKKDNKLCMWHKALKIFLIKYEKYKEDEKLDINYEMQNFIQLCNNKKKILYINRFLEMLCHFITFNDAIEIFDNLKQNLKISDLDIINKIQTLKNSKNTIFSENIDYEPIELEMEKIQINLSNILKKLNIHENKNLNYLDLCCGNGKKTKFFASNLDIINIHGTDIEQWGPYKKNRILDFDFSNMENNKIMYDDNSFDIVTCFLSLHHIPNLTNILNEVYRVLKDDGLFFIIENDVFNFYDELLINIQHKLFAVYYDNNMEYISNPDYIRYFNFFEWNFIFKNTGKFTFIESRRFTDDFMSIRYDNQFYMIYKKRDPKNTL